MSLLPTFLRDIVGNIGNMTSVAFKELLKFFLTDNQDANFEDETLQDDWKEMEQLHNKKLWHQLTLKMLDFVKHPQMERSDNLIKFYNSFVMPIEMKINPMSLVELAEQIVTQYKDPHCALEFLSKIEEKVKSNGMAVFYCKVLQGKILLNNLDDRPQTKHLMEQVNEFIDESNEVSVIHKQFYLLASQFYEREGDYGDYYQNVLRYLACIEDLEGQLTVQQRQQYAYRLCISALLADDVYNLGELLLHPILTSLENTTFFWIVNLVRLSSRGDLKMLEKMRRYWRTVPELKRNEAKITQKIRLLGLMEIAFLRGSKQDLQLSFEDVAKQTQLPKEEVEFVVMKAFAKGLIQGSIDQVAETVNVTWVKPRVLETPQINQMIHHLDQWCQDVKTCEILIESNASEILTQ